MLHGIVRRREAGRWRRSRAANDEVRDGLGPVKASMAPCNTWHKASVIGLGLGTWKLTLTAAASYVLQGHLHVERNAVLGCVDVCGGGKRVCWAELCALWRARWHEEAIAVPLWLWLGGHGGGGGSGTRRGALEKGNSDARRVASRGQK